jgi:NAD(P)H-dependent FMN reductase
VGSTREGRFGPTVAKWFIEHAEQREDVMIDVIDLAEARLPAHLSSGPGPKGAQALAWRLWVRD